MARYRRFEMLKKSALSATYNIFLQFFLKMISFVLNMIVIRHISAELLGVVQIRLFLLYTTILFISTEPFDMACLSKMEGKNWRQVLNLAWLTVPTSILLSVVCSCFWLFVFEVPDPEVVPNYTFGVIAFALSAVICNLARPQFILAMAYFFVGLRVASLALSESFKCLVTAVLIIWKPDLGLFAFSVGHLAGEILYTSIYYIFFYLYVENETPDPTFPLQSAGDVLFRKKEGEPTFDKRLTILTKSFFKQCFLKIFLTEGEKYVMTIFRVMTLAEQGVYGTVNNLGAMVPRFIFQPIEESGRIFFSQLLHRGEIHIGQSNAEGMLAYQVLKHLLRAMYLIGCLILVFGNSYAYLFLHLYGGKTLSEGSGPYILKWFCVYVLILAINGIMECFHFSLMDTIETDRYNTKMLIFSLISLACSLVLPQWFGGAGFILANCAVMLARIFFSLLFINHYYDGTELKPLRSLIPSLPLTVSLGAAFIITKISENTLCCHLGFKYRVAHIGVGAGCGIAVLIVIYLTEKELFNFIRTQYSKQEPQQRNDYVKTD